jgi:hypothetical protein
MEAEKQRVKYSETEMKFRQRLIDDMEYSRNQRDQPHVEFDDMDYITYWKTNAKAGNAYMPPKTDPQEVRTTSGTTLEKKNTLLSNLLNLNLEADIEAFDDQDKKMDELGRLMQDMVRKSREVEQYDKKKRLNVYNEFLNQGTVFAEERFNEYKFIGKEVDDNFSVDRIDKMKWKKSIDKVYSECSTQLITGLNVYLANIREQDIEMQPYVFIRRVIPKSEAESLYGSWARWENVPFVFSQFSGSDQTDDTAYNDWTLEEYQRETVEEIRYFNKWTNDFMILLNGVMMFPVRENGTFPLSGILGICEYPIAMAVAEPITNFAYGKSIPAKTKVDQALFDEMLKALIVKTRKSYNPPLANNTGEHLSKRVQYAGNVTDDINPDMLQPIGDNGGVTQAEFHAIQFIKGIIDNKSVDPIMEGQSGGNRTLGEIQEMKKQSMVSMGLSIMGIQSLEARLAELRIYNILKNWTKPLEGEEAYRKISLEVDFEDGERGVREIEFTENLPDEIQIYAEEELKRKITGKAYRKAYINPKVMRSIKYKWFTNVTPTQKQSDALKQAQFEESVQKAIAIFAPLGKMPNTEYLATRWATNQGENPEQFWQQQQPQMPGTPQMGGQPPNQIGGQLTPDQMPKPSVNTLANA